VNTLDNRYDALEKLIFDQGLRISDVQFGPGNEKMFIRLINGASFIIDLSYYRVLKKASPSDLKNFKLIAEGTGIHWPALDEDLSLKGLLKDFLRSQMEGGKRELVIG
jgi:hypothetical protein